MIDVVDFLDDFLIVVVAARLSEQSLVRERLPRWASALRQYEDAVVSAARERLALPIFRMTSGLS